MSYMHEPLDESAYQVNICDKWDISWYTIRECCIIILYHAIENTVVNTINVTYAWHMMERLDVIPNVEYTSLGFPVFWFLPVFPMAWYM